MFASIQSQAAATSAVAAPASSSAPLGRVKLEARFAAMLEGAEVSAEIWDKFGDMGLTELSLLTSLCKDDDSSGIR